MSQIAIKGHTSRGKEVIEILETLGGKNEFKLPGDTSRAYYVLEYGEIHVSPYIYGNEPYTFFTLEEFEGKYPFKVDDKVIYNEEYIAKIVGMSWDEDVDEVYYSITSHGETFKCPVDLLQPYKEETIGERENSIVVNIEHKQLKVNSLRFDKTQLVINDGYELKQEGDTYYIVRKQPQYPEAYEECCEVLGIEEDLCFVYEDIDGNHINPACISNYRIRRLDLYRNLEKLRICRDAYWKIAGEQIGLGKPWEQDYDDRCFIIANNNGNIYTYEYHGSNNVLLAFPTEEMRDAFYENFKDLIEQCKELL